jgi:hypothetical protein
MYRQIYDNHASLMRFLSDIPMALPKVLSVTSEFVINAALRRAFEDESLDFGRIASLLDAARRENLNLDHAGLSYTLTGRVNSLMQAFAAMPEDSDTLSRMNVLFDMVRTMPFKPDLWKVQNLYYGLTQTLCLRMIERSDPNAQEWIRQFLQLGEKLGLSVQIDLNQGSQADLAIA